jgi:hypothetical protein
VYCPRKEESGCKQAKRMRHNYTPPNKLAFVFKRKQEAATVFKVSMFQYEWEDDGFY